MKYIIEIWKKGKCVKTILAEGDRLELLSQLSDEYSGVFRFYQDYYGIESTKIAEPA